jgi:DNA ligase D-like protein (predicted polymerase)/DNA ligase D-like protein (predicted 3'-phosphoesterase)
MTIRTPTDPPNATAPDSLALYRSKRNFDITSEPSGEMATAPSDALSFVIQKHAATSLHYDFRLELDGTLKSWAVPKGPSLDPSEKRLAIEVEDHPLSYGGFEGVIPPNQYGSGTVIVWDRGTWQPIGDAHDGLSSGRLKFELHGEKLSGAFMLLRTRRGGGDAGKQQWLLIKEHDDAVRQHEAFDVTAEMPDSVLSSATIARLADGSFDKTHLGQVGDAPPAPATKVAKHASPRAAKLSMPDEADAVLPGEPSMPSKKTVRAKPPKAVSAVAPLKPGDGSVDGVRISHPDRVIDATTGTTKLGLGEFYAAVEPWIHPHLVDRPVGLLRAPDGIEGELFFQKHSVQRVIPSIRSLDPALDPGHPALMVIDSLQALLGSVQMNAVELHTWNATAASIEQPDRFVLDLDPGEGLEWKTMLENVAMIRGVLDELGLRSFLKTSGGKGMHIVVPHRPQHGWEAVKALAHAVASHLAMAMPERFSDKMGAPNRVGKVFVDFMRNNRGASTVVAYSVRARPGLGVSTPLRWDELDGVTSGAQWHVGNLLERLDGLKADPWEDYDRDPPSLDDAMKALGIEPADHD